MSENIIEPIRRYDGAGRLEAAGVRWTEVRNGVLWLIALPAFILLMTMILSGLFMVAKGFPLKTMLVFAGSVAGLALAVTLVNRFGGRRRSLIFHRDGRIETPEGIPTNSRFREFAFGHDRISTFENRFARALDRNHSQYFIDLFGRDGDWVTVADALSEQHSHMLTVQLTKALAEMRETAARPRREFTAEDALRMARAAMAGGRPGDTVHVVIE
ncbi:MAG: hypothetical protein AB7E70_09575 [Hyphomicrobiaceae bacterium]